MRFGVSPRGPDRTPAGRTWSMKTLAKAPDAAELLDRLARLQPGSTRRWGRMTAHEMVCHLADGFRMAAGVSSQLDVFWSNGPSFWSAWNWSSVSRAMPIAVAIPTALSFGLFSLRDSSASGS